VTRVAVVGAGVVGLAAARAAAKQGAEVQVYEQFELGHDRGSSHGRSRIFRLAYAEREWVELAQDALFGWRELEAESGDELLELPGLVEIVHDPALSSGATLDACGVEWQALSPQEVERRFPVRVAEGAYAILQPVAGIVRADLACQAFLAGAIARGADVVQHRRVDSLAALDADVVIVTAGAWAKELLAASGIALDVRVTRETVAYFRLATDEPIPAVVELRPGTRSRAVYALRDPEHGLKVGCHMCGPEADPGAKGEPDPQTVRNLSEWAAEHFPAADPEPVGAETCFYTSTADERFVLERHGRIVVGSACSGHGFKFAPAVGERLAALALER
jgi:sarcosine oxidase